MRNRTGLCFALGGLAAVLVAGAQPGASHPGPQGTAAAPGPQQPGPAAPPKTPAPVVRTTTRLVQVTVVAHHKGSPVADMTQDDFHVFDNGQEQTIAFFSKETGHVLEEPAAPLPKDTWSNRTETRKGIPINVTMILYDGLNTRVMDQNFAREQIVKFLSAIRPEDRVALYTLGKDLRVLHDFTSDATSLLRVLSKYKGYTGPEIPSSALDPETEPEVGAGMSPAAAAAAANINSFLQGVDEAYNQMQTVNRVARTADALEAIAAHVAGIPGRKNLIWVSGAFPFTMGFDNLLAGPAANPQLDSRDFAAEVQRAARALADANVAVYPVDAHGLGVGLGSTLRMAQAPRRGYADPNPRISQEDLTIQTIQTLAERTGGRAYYRTNDLSGAIRGAIEDSEVTYTLAYSPAHNEWNGKFRTIKVTTKRPGTELRYRMGYFAMPDKELEPTQSEQMAYAAQWSTLEATEIGLTVKAVRTTINERPAVSFTLLLDTAGVRFNEEDGRHSTNLLLILAERAEDGRVVTGDSRTLALKLKDDTYQRAMMKGLPLGGTLLLDPAAIQFRLVILDQSTGRLGSVDVPVAQLRVVPEAPAASKAPGAAPAPAPAGANPPEKPEP